MKPEFVSRAAGCGGAQGLIFAQQEGADIGAHQMKPPGGPNGCARLRRNLSAVCSLIGICLQCECRQKTRFYSIPYMTFSACLQCLQCFCVTDRKPGAI